MTASVQDARTGRPLIRELDQAIKLYDKVVVILSKASLGASGVLDEIERAVDRESRAEEDVLFPIRLDDAVFSWEHHRRTNLTQRTIADFTSSQDQKSYRVALQKLVNDLRAGEATRKANPSH